MMINLAIVGNSLTASTPIHSAAWPTIAAPCMPGVYLTNWAVDGNTSFRQLASGQNALIAASKPDVIVIGLNYNETIPAPGGVDGRTPAQIEADAFALFDWYKANIPGVRLIHLKELWGRMLTPEYSAFIQIVETGRQWDGFIEMGYETCIDAAALITSATLVDSVHPARVTCHMQAAAVVSALVPWFGLPAQVAQWSNVEAFMAAFKANDPYALAAARSLTT